LSVNVEKFKEPASPIVPDVREMWKSALAGIQQNATLQVDHPDRDSLRGYPVPDPYLFAKGRDDLVGVWKYIVAWLCIRSTWLGQVVARENFAAGYPKPQHWRQGLLQLVLAHGLGKDLKAELSAGEGKALQTHGSDKGKKRLQDRDRVTEGSDTNKRRRTKALQDVGDIFKMFLQAPSGQAVDVFWQGQVVLKAIDIKAGSLALPDSVARQVMWDLFENNFRIELLTLDRAIVPRASNDMWALDRDQLVLKVFPGGALMVNRWTVLDVGLGARKWGVCACYVEAFRVLLSTWPGDPARQLGGMCVGSYTASGFQSSEKQVMAVERIALPFYCQTFFNYFGRAPTIPHIRP